jgi:superfamily I DNA/RNA helicase/RecB family exonuclease
VDQNRLDPADWPAALTDTDGRQIIVAGPGTGKTEFLVRRVGAIIEMGRADPTQIVVLSFSRRATSKLRDRIEQVTGATGVPVDVTTFHSLAMRLIEAATGGERPVPLTTPEQVGLVRETLAEEDTGSWPVIYRGILESQVFSAEVADFLLRCSERLLGPEDLALRARERPDWRGLPGLYSRYLARLNDIGRTDYGVLLAKAVDWLRSPTGPDLTYDFRYVLVDEYQDTTPAQAAMAELLAARHDNLTVAGDPYQSIFSFRGAELRNIAEFSGREGTKRYVLGQSFRVPAPIMESALRVVSGGDLPGSAGPVVPASHPGRAEMYVFDQETAEAEWIAREVEHLVRVEGVSPASIAVIVRSKRELISELSRALDRRSLPHDPPSSRLVDHPAVRLIQDLATVAIFDDQPARATPLEAAAAERAMRRILLGPLMGVSIGLERTVFRDLRRRPRPWREVVATHLGDENGLVSLLSDASWATGMGAADGFWAMWTTLDGISRLVHDRGRDEWRRAWTAFAQMLNRQADRDPGVTLARFFEMVDEEDFEATPLISHRLTADRVSLTTLHQVKGLEFEVVFIANAVEGVFPDLRRSRRMLRPELLSPERTLDAEAQHLFQIQEEMRLAYTAMTRARRRLVWTATEAGVDQGERRPSRFLKAAAGGAEVGPPVEEERDPITIREAEIAMRRSLLDVAAGPTRRLAAARVLGAPGRSWWDPTAFAGAIAPGPDSPVLAETFRLSPSQAESYRRCPRRYVLERRLRLGDSTSVYAHFGELAHEVLEIAEGEVVGSGRPHAELERVLVVLDDVWGDADFGSPDLDAAWKAKAVDMFTKLYERWPGRGEPVEVELGVDAEIEGVRWIGRIDRLERSADGYRVVDYKTSGHAPRKEDAEQSIQLGFYAHAVAEAMGPVVASEMWFPRTPTNSVTTRKFAMHQLADVTETMVEITRSIGAEDWRPRVSVDCRRCGFRRSCPAWPEGRGAFLP